MKKVFAVFIACMTVWAQVPKKVTLQTFGESDLLLIHTKKGFSTLIEFPEGHGIQEVTCGDKDFWVVEGKGRFLHVKPAKEGAVTNLNVLLDGDVVYSFLLKEISTKTGAILKPDLRVVVNGGDDVAKLRKDKDNLEEALTRSARALKDLSDKYDAEKKAALKKNDEPSEEIKPKANGATATTAGSPISVATVRPGTSDPAPAQGVVAPEERPIVSAYVVEKQGGAWHAGWLRIKSVFRRVVHGN